MIGCRSTRLIGASPTAPQDQIGCVASATPIRWPVMTLARKRRLLFGVTGAPETFVVDPQGIIRYKHVGPVTQQVWDDTLAPLIEHLRAEAANKSKGEGG